MTRTPVDCDARLACLLFDRSPAPDAATHEATCPRCHGDAPAAQRNEPSLEFAAEKEQFGAVRRARWFGRS